MSNEKIQEDCNLIKEDMLSNLEISEEQLSFACRLEDNEYIINTSIVPIEGEELPSDLVNKLKDGIPLTNIEKIGEGGDQTNTVAIVTAIIALTIIIIMSFYFYS